MKPHRIISLAMAHTNLLVACEQVRHALNGTKDIIQQKDMLAMIEQLRRWADEVFDAMVEKA